MTNTGTNFEKLAEICTTTHQINYIILKELYKFPLLLLLLVEFTLDQ